LLIGKENTNFERLEEPEELEELVVRGDRK
jgi:hypothetical protein